MPLFCRVFIGDRTNLTGTKSSLKTPGASSSFNLIPFGFRRRPPVPTNRVICQRNGITWTAITAPWKNWNRRLQHCVQVPGRLRQWLILLSTESHWWKKHGVWFFDAGVAQKGSDWKRLFLPEDCGRKMCRIDRRLARDGDDVCRKSWHRACQLRRSVSGGKVSLTLGCIAGRNSLIIVKSNGFLLVIGQRQRIIASFW